MKKPFLFFVIFSFQLISNLSAQNFYGYYTYFKSAEPFEQYLRIEEYADVVIKMEKPAGQLVFWHGKSYYPFLQMKFSPLNRTDKSHG